MNTKTMEGLAGASTNMNLINTPMRVYKEAERKGDLTKMERAADYAGKFASKAQEYQNKAEEGMKEEAEEFEERVRSDREKAKEARKKQRLEYEKMIAHRKEEAAKLEQITEGAQVTDTVEVSEEGRKMLEGSVSVNLADTDGGSSDAAAGSKSDFVKEPVIYTSAGEVSHTVQDAEIKISV